MKRTITYTIKDEVSNKVLVEQSEDLHEFEQNEAGKYFKAKRIIDRAEDIVKDLK